MRLTPPPEIKVTYRLNFISSATLIGIGVLVDALQFIPSLTGVGEIFSEVIGLLADVLIPMIAFVLGVRFGIGEITTFIGTDGVEILPFVNDLPGYTAQTVTLVLMTRSKDIERAVAKAAEERKKQATRQQAIARQQHFIAARNAQAANDAARQAVNDNQGTGRERMAA